MEKKPTMVIPGASAGTVRIVLFEEACSLALDRLSPAEPLDDDLRATIAAAPMDRQGRRRREIQCTEAESARLLRFYTAMGSLFDVLEDSQRARACNDARVTIILARRLVGLGP